MITLDKFIVTVPGVLSPEYCAELIAAKDGETKPALVEGNKVHESRTCSQIVVDEDWAIAAGMFKAVGEYRIAHPDAKVTGAKNNLFLKYETGQFYTQHCDSFPGNPRLLTISIALNDDFEGGEWSWFDRSIVKRFSTGDAVVFPSNFMFPHEILPVTKGTRYSLINWFTE